MCEVVRTCMLKKRKKKNGVKARKKNGVNGVKKIGGNRNGECQPCPAATEQVNKEWYAQTLLKQNGKCKPCNIPMQYTPCRYHFNAKSCLRGESGCLT